MKFYRAWLPLTKTRFRIMAMLADKGKFSGNLSDMCRYFSVTPQTKTRDKIKEGIMACQSDGLITVNQKGQKWELEIIPQNEETAITINAEWFVNLRNRAKSENSISWEALLKVFLWIYANDPDIIVTNDWIAIDTGLSTAVICLAKDILFDEFGAITKKRISKKVVKDDKESFRNLGQLLGGNAFWLE